MAHHTEKENWELNVDYCKRNGSSFIQIRVCLPSGEDSGFGLLFDGDLPSDLSVDSDEIKKCMEKALPEIRAGLFPLKTTE